MKRRYTEQQIIGFLREAESGVSDQVATNSTSALAFYSFLPRDPHIQRGACQV
jgi:hypothetical protein